MIELADVVRDLRSELDRARAATADSGVLFELGPIELEMSVGLERKGGATGRINFWVVEMGGEASATSVSTQRIKLTLQPTLASAAKDSVYISGDEAENER